MKSCLVFIVLLVYGAALPALEQDVRLGSHDVGKLSRGLIASTGQFPYQASLRTSSGTHICGGAILNTRSIITAAHCVSSQSTATLFVYVGSNSLLSGARYAVDRIIVHASYNPNILSNDIAVLQTAASMPSNSMVRSIPIGTTQVGGGVTATLIGWGTLQDGTVSNNLRFIDLLTITNANCATLLTPLPVFTTHLCTMISSGTCVGDSGGPLVSRTNTVLIGVETSSGRSCTESSANIFVRVSSYISWIQSAINSRA